MTRSATGLIPLLWASPRGPLGSPRAHAAGPIGGFSELAQSLFPVPGIRDACAEDLQLHFKVLFGGASIHGEGIVIDAQAPAHVASGGNTLEIVRAVLPQPARIQENGGKHIQARLVCWLGQICVTKAGVHTDRVFLEVRTLQIDTYIVRKDQLGNAEVLDFPARSYRSRLAEVGICKGDIFFLLGGIDLHLLTLSIERSEGAGSVFRRGLGGQGNCEIPVLPEALQGFMTFLKGEGLNRPLPKAEGLSWTGEDPVGVDTVYKAHGQRGGLAGVRSLDGLLFLIDDFGLRFVQFR